MIPPLQAACWLGVQQVLASLGGRRTPRAGALVAGSVALSVAASLGSDALRRFASAGTTWHPWAPQDTSALVTDGPNALTRNPMYVGLALGLVGTGLLSGRPWTAAAALGLLASLTPQVEREEAALADSFGDAWRAYVDRTPRWLGRPVPRR